MKLLFPDAPGQINMVPGQIYTTQTDTYAARMDTSDLMSDKYKT